MTLHLGGLDWTERWAEHDADSAGRVKGPVAATGMAPLGLTLRTNSNISGVSLYMSLKYTQVQSSMFFILPSPGFHMARESSRFFSSEVVFVHECDFPFEAEGSNNKQ